MPAGRQTLEAFLLEHVVLQLGTLHTALGASVKFWPATARPDNREVTLMLSRLSRLEDQAMALCTARPPLLLLGPKTHRDGPRGDPPGKIRNAPTTPGPKRRCAAPPGQRPSAPKGGRYW